MGEELPAYCGREIAVDRKVVPFEHVADHARSDHPACLRGIHFSPQPVPMHGCPLAPSLTIASGSSAFAHVGGFSAEQEVVARRREEIDHLAVFAEPSLVLRTSWNDHDVARAADSLFAAEAKLHLAFEHPHDLLICVTVRLDMDTSPNAPPYEHSLITGENATADLFADLFLR